MAWGQRQQHGSARRRACGGRRRRGGSAGCVPPHDRQPAPASAVARSPPPPLVTRTPPVPPDYSPARTTACKSPPHKPPSTSLSDTPPPQNRCPSPPTWLARPLRLLLGHIGKVAVLRGAAVPRRKAMRCCAPGGAGCVCDVAAAGPGPGCGGVHVFRSPGPACLPARLPSWLTGIVVDQLMHGKAARQAGRQPGSHPTRSSHSRSTAPTPLCGSRTRRRQGGWPPGRACCRRARHGATTPLRGGAGRRVPFTVCLPKRHPLGHWHLPQRHPFGHRHLPTAQGTRRSGGPVPPALGARL